MMSVSGVAVHAAVTAILVILGAWLVAMLLMRRHQVEPFSHRSAAQGPDTVKLTKTGLADPQDDGLESCCEPACRGSVINTVPR